MSTQPDIIVVGGGVIGLSCAWRLGQAGVRVLLLERGEVGSGASGASLGALIPAAATRQGPAQRLQRASLWSYPEFVAEVAAVSGIDCGYRRCGRLELLVSEGRRAEALRESVAAARDWPVLTDAPVLAVVGADQALALEPRVRVGEFGAVHCRASACIDVPRLIAGLRIACERTGVTVRTGAEVSCIQVEDGRAVGVRRGDELIGGGGVLVTAGAWTTRLARELERSAVIEPVRGQALMLRCERDWFERIIKRQSTYLAPRGNGVVLVGSTTEPDSGFNDKPNAQGVAELTSAAVELAPELENASVVAVWAGLRPRPAAGRPYLGAVPRVSRLYVAAGHYKTGVCLAPATGRLMADVIVRGKSDLDLTPFAPTTTEGAA